MKKCPVCGKKKASGGELSRLCPTCGLSVQYWPKVEQLHTVVDKCPKTADGVPVVPGIDVVFDGRPDTPHCWGGSTEDPDRTRLLGVTIHVPEYSKPAPAGGVDWAEAYSSAAEALKAAKATQGDGGAK